MPREPRFKYSIVPASPFFNRTDREYQVVDRTKPEGERVRGSFKDHDDAVIFMEALKMIRR